MKITIIGAGNMGGAIARSLASVPEYDLTVSNPSKVKLERLQSEFPSVKTTSDNREAVTGADVVILAVKPWIVEGVVDEIRPLIDGHSGIVVSVAAGVSTKRLQELFADVTMPVFAAIPNTAVSVGCGMTFIASAGADDRQRAIVSGLFRHCGDVMEVDEEVIDACMALASCGIAYVMRYVRAAVEGGVELGLRPDVAQRVMLQTMRGAAALLEATGNNPEVEIDKVTTPGGLTIRGLNVMEEAGFSASVIKGLRASVKK